ncbi:MAG: hypothetical protein JJU02_00730 [Cryomorphaceae bacterium]|nr:hypothetical protein [Cryomorphaceae bacterium]
MRIQKSTDKEDFGRKGLFRADSCLVCPLLLSNMVVEKNHQILGMKN